LASPCYVINLDSRDDRRSEFYSQVDKAGILVERVSAIQSDSIGENHTTPPGVTACWLSHQKALKQFLDTGEAYGIFFEDDAVFGKSGLEFVRDFDKYQKPDFDLLQIGYLRKHGKLDSGEIDFVVHWKTKFSLILQKIRSSNRKQTQILGGQLLVADSFEAGTHAYICNRAMAKRLVTFNNPVILAADLALIQVARSKQSKCFRLSHSLVGQSDSFSSINLRQSFRGMGINT